MSSPENPVTVRRASQLTRGLRPTASYVSILKASRDLGDFYHFYFDFHGLDVEAFIRHMPVLLFTEATLYQVDEDSEEHPEDGYVSPHFETLKSVLSELGLLDEALATELDLGMEYYRLERLLTGGGPFGEEEVLKASRYKCYDFRILHRLLHRLERKPAEPAALEVFWLGEVLVDLADDIRQVERDAPRNVHNTCLLFRRLYGDQADARLGEYLRSLEAEMDRHVREAPPGLGERLAPVADSYRKLMGVLQPELHGG